MKLSNPEFLAPLLMAALLTTAAGVQGQQPREGVRAGERAEVIRADPVRAADRRAIERSTELATQPNPEIRYVGVERPQFDAALLGTTRLYEALSHARNQPAVDRRALARAAATNERITNASVATGEIRVSDLESARLAEAELTLTYWKADRSLFPDVTLNTRQLGYVAKNRFQHLLDAASGESGSLSELARSNSRLTVLLKHGQAHAEALASDVSDRSDPNFVGMIASLDRFADRLEAGSLGLSEASIVGLVDSATVDLGQLKTYSISFETSIDVNVNTLLGSDPDAGHIVRYELRLDYEMEEFQSLSFDRVSSPANHSLGPFHYYLWAEKDGHQSSPPRLVNLGEPLQAERTIDLVLLQPEPDEPDDPVETSDPGPPDEPDDPVETSDPGPPDEPDDPVETSDPGPPDGQGDPGVENNL